MTGDLDRLARFDREARTLAALNHPHIAQVYGLEALPNGPADSSGRFEVYVQSFPELGPRQQISIEGGDSPLWSKNGRELFFRSGAAGVSRISAVEVTTGPAGIAFGKPRQLFEGRFAYTGNPTAYDISLDGSRFLMTEMLDPPKQPVTGLRLVLNWFEVLRRAQTLTGSS